MSIYSKLALTAVCAALLAFLLCFVCRVINEIAENDSVARWSVFFAKVFLISTLLCFVTGIVLAVLLIWNS